MSVGLAVHGYSDEALKLFRTMETHPDEVTPKRITLRGVGRVFWIPRFSHVIFKFLDSIVKQKPFSDLLAMQAALQMVHTSSEQVSLKLLLVRVQIEEDKSVGAEMVRRNTKGKSVCCVSHGGRMRWWDEAGVSDRRADTRKNH